MEAPAVQLLLGRGRVLAQLEQRQGQASGPLAMRATSSWRWTWLSSPTHASCCRWRPGDNRVSWPRVSGGSLRRTARCSGPCHRAPPKRQTRSSVRMNADWRPPLMPTPMDAAVSARSRVTPRGGRRARRRSRRISTTVDGPRIDSQNALDVGRSGIVAEPVDHGVGPRLDGQVGGPGCGRRCGGQVGRGGGGQVGQVLRQWVMVGLLGFRRDKRSDLDAFPAQSPWQPPRVMSTAW